MSWDGVICHQGLSFLFQGDLGPQAFCQASLQRSGLVPGIGKQGRLPATADSCSRLEAQGQPASQAQGAPLPAAGAESESFLLISQAADKVPRGRADAQVGSVTTLVICTAKLPGKQGDPFPR